MFLVGTVRIAVINNDGQISAAAEQNSVVVTLSHSRGRIFDCNLNALTGNFYENYAVITPSEQSIMYCSTAFSGEEKISILGKLRNGKPAVVKTEEISCAGVLNVKVPVFDKNDFCVHLLGYTDSSNHGVSGLQKAMDEYLYSDEKITVRYASNAQGQILGGIEPIVSGDTLSTTGVVTTIDRNVQVVIEKAAQNLKKGAIVVSEAGTGKIRGMLSRPTFTKDNISELLDSADSPLMNRALKGYNVGSAFKPCVALSNGKLSNMTVECEGSMNIENSTFFCHLRSGHKTTDIKDALINSCNSFFYRFALNVGGDKLYQTATLFGFGYNKTLVDGISTEGECIPTRSELSDNRVLANFSIGQGKFLASPVTMLSLYEAIACGGQYHQATLIEGIMENAKLTEKNDKKPPTKAIDKNTANMLKNYLKEVVISGTGKNAHSQRVDIAGKTATAQTGWVGEDGNSIEHSWFCGFFPADNPKYIAVVLVEDSANSTSSATEIFKYIAEGLTN